MFTSELSLREPVNFCPDNRKKEQGNILYTVGMKC
jgi:hypothetical protein